MILIERAIRCVSCTLIVLFLSLVNFASLSSANDYAVEGFPASGIVARDEANIQIKREDLYISSSKIEVTYLFRNHSNNDIVTEVAFPVPPHTFDPSRRLHYPLHGDFHVIVNGAEFKYQEITRALINGKDCTNLLNKLGISFKDFDAAKRQGGLYYKYFYTLSYAKRKEYIDLGIVKIDETVPEGPPEKPYYGPAWFVETTYHWTQRFPAKSTTTIKHIYTPNPAEIRSGDDDIKRFSNRRHDIDPTKSDLADVLCLDDDLNNWLKARNWMLDTKTVDYILTTANHWKKPIKEFHLIIEADTRPNSNERVSTCFLRQLLTKVNEKRYELTIKDFEPKEEISVYFMSYDQKH
jgi:hypothetical protein